MKRTAQNISLMIVSIACIALLSSCDEWSVPKELQGVWSGKQYLKVRLEDENGKYQFPGDSVVIS
ncbi:MAG: hypothetical protein ACOYNS_09280, partial [Bacteroidota bacterium]